MRSPWTSRAPEACAQGAHPSGAGTWHISTPTRRIQGMRLISDRHYTMRRRGLWLFPVLAMLAAALALPPQLSAQQAEGQLKHSTDLPMRASRSATQEAKKPQDQERPIRVQVELVHLFATVRDKKKRLIPDLNKNEFRILENGQGQKIDYFTRDTSLPITLGLLIDTSGSETAMLGVEQDVASRFLRRVLRKGDLAMVITFDLDVDLLADFTEDTARLERAIHRARINAPSGVTPGPIPQRGSRGTNLYDAIYLACREKLAGEVGRKALVILTDGVDTGSKLRLEDALEAAQRTDTVIHVIGISDPAFYGFRSLGSNGEGVAKKLAQETGGRAIFVRDEKKLEQAFDEITEELRSQYTLGYYPSNKARDGAFRKIKIETTRSGLAVLARKGYYAPKN